MPTATVPRPRRREGAGSQRGPRGKSKVRGWITLIVLALVVGALSIGWPILSELLMGVTYHRPPAAAPEVVSAATGVAHPDLEMQRRLDAVARSLGNGHIALATVNLQTNGYASVDADRPYPAASLFKVPLLIEVLKEEDAGRLDPQQLLEIREDDWTDGSGVLQARVGDQLAVRELSQLMIQESDNIAALVLLDAVGVGAVNATAEELGLHSTRLVDHRGGQPGDHTTSAADMSRLLVLLASGAAINQHVSESALATLELKQNISWLTDDLPFWVKVAHKWGDLPEARNDVGIVYSPRGSYVLAALTEGSEPADAAAAISQASRMAYDAVGGRS
jgi:beta-lactamase class A